MSLISTIISLVLVFLGQQYVAPLLQIGNIKPDFILIFLIFIAARYGRMTGIIIGFGAGLFQDLTGSLTVLGASALVNSCVGFVVGTLNGNLTVWTSRVVNLYIYASLAGHAILYQFIMLLGLKAPFALYMNNMLIEFIISVVLITGSRYLIPLVAKDS
ncbi:rod shape-determining protein MreD [Candidatus Neomarinimicrobiota bacterium]